MNGKGDRPRNNFSARYRDGYDAIDWGHIPNPIVAGWDLGVESEAVEAFTRIYENKMAKLDAKAQKHSFYEWLFHRVKKQCKKGAKAK